MARFWRPFSGEDLQLGILAAMAATVTSWWPAAVARKAAAADQDPDQGEDLQLDPRGHGGHGGVLAPV